MRDFTPDDYSQIFGPDEKPTQPGWYVCASYRPYITYTNDFSQIQKIMFDYWDGEEWLTYPNREAYTEQRRYWFGLREKP